MADELPRINDVIADRYRILSPVGQGGMGVVYRALDTRANETVAIKMLHPRAFRDRQARERFTREIRILRQLEHPHIVRIIDDAQDDKLQYFTMEFITGPNLLAFADSLDLLPLEHAVLLVGQICSALHHAHKLGIIHRDLKPTNVIIQDGKRAKLLDFGLAREQEDAALTLPGQALGTAAYMAPEVGRGESAGPAADIYALGCLFFQLATGRLPFVAESPIDIILLHQKGEIPSISTYRPDIPHHMEETCRRALAKDPRERFGSARRFYEHLIGQDPTAGGAGSETFPAFDVYSTTSFGGSEAAAIAEWSVFQEIEIPTAGVLGAWCVHPSPNFDLLIVGADGVEGPLVMRVAENKWAKLGSHGAGVGVRSAAWSRSGKLLAFVNSQRLAVVDMAHNRCLARLDVSNHRPWKVDFVPDDPEHPSVAMVGESGGAIIWRGWPDSTPEVFRAHKTVARALKVSPGGGTIATGGLDGTLNFWKSRNNEKRGSLKQKDAAFWDVTFSESGEYLAAASSDKDLPVLIYRSAGGSFEGQRVKCAGRALSLAFSASERLLAVGGHERVIFVERDDQGRWEVAEKCAVDGEVRGLCFGKGDRTIHAVTSKGALISLRRGKTESVERQVPALAEPAGEGSIAP
jgi:tRNA A-37 threonylcarbamoyl transferase component Bud32